MIVPADVGLRSRGEPMRLTRVAGCDADGIALRFGVNMALSTSFLPNKDAALLAWGQNFFMRINPSPEIYGLTKTQSDAFGVKNTAYAAAYQTAIDPISRTRGKIAAKNAAREALKIDARLLASIIEGQANITNEQKIDLGLTVRKTPSKNPPPTERPAVNIVSVTGRTVTIRIRDTAESSKRGKPAGVLGASVYSYVGTTYPTDPTAWSFDGTTTKTTHAIVFADSVANGAQIWVCATWFNRKTETGPISIPVTTNVQGGLGVSVQPALKMAA